MEENHTDLTKVVLITGAARRIGAEIARTLHASGMNVVVHYHTSTKEAASLCDFLNEQRLNSAALVQANLTEIENFNGLLEQAANKWGRLDALVNNASKFYRTEMGGVSESAWDDLMDSNLKGPFFLAQAAKPYLMKTEGSIINIADIHGDRPMRDYSAYCISKAGLIMATKVLAKELGPHIRVNAVSPTVMIWPEGENEISGLLQQKIIDKTVLERMGSPKDVAKAVLYLIKDAGYVTGEVLKVDGGRSLFI